MKEEHRKLYRNIADSVVGQPETCDELLHKYGTYEIQPTAEADNEFPEIAQGLAKQGKQKSIEKNKKHKDCRI